MAGRTSQYTNCADLLIVLLERTNNDLLLIGGKMVKIMEMYDIVFLVFSGDSDWRA